MDICFDCFSGVSGDMLVGALLDIGASEEILKEKLNSLNLKDYDIKISKISKNGYMTTDFDVVLKENNFDDNLEYLFGNKKFPKMREERNLNDVFSIIDNSNLSEKSKLLSKKIFSLVAYAEGKAHNVPMEKVFFHESGAMDSIIDVVSFAVCIDNLNKNNVYAKNLCEGKGHINCRVGKLPIPVPAVKNILEKFNLTYSEINQNVELITPTGIACLASIAKFNYSTKHDTIKTGYGNGKRSYNLPCVLKVEVLK